MAHQDFRRTMATAIQHIAATAFLTGATFGAMAQGAPYAEGPLLEIIKEMPEGSWAKVNENAFSDVWTPAALRPLYGSSSNPTPSKILGSWSSFAWDSKRGDLILYGGGHANYSGNDVYRWRSRDLQWSRAALPSETFFVGSNTWNAIDGADAAPTSAHTYDNAVYLPIADRYLNFGGAIYNTGGAYTRPDELIPGALRQTGPYLFDPSRADPDKVGGTTGSHVQRVAPYADILGGNMWENRDIHKHLSHLTRPRSHINGCTAYNQSPEGHDVVFVAARTGGTALDLYRYDLIDINDPSFDELSRVGVYWSGPSGQTTCAHDPILNIVLRTGTNANPFYFWDLNPERITNRDQRVAVVGSVRDLSDWLTDAGKAITHCAIDYDPVRSEFLLWCGTGEVWSIVPPSTPTGDGWTVIRHPAEIGETPPGNVGVGILGKWKYIPGFDVFMGLEDVSLGNIWVYKPEDWIPPGSDGGNPGDDGDNPGDDDGNPGDGGSQPGDGPDPVNQPPVISLTQPTSTSALETGTTLLMQAEASDPDGTVAMVVFKINGGIVGMSNVAPYVASWTVPSAGAYSVSAEVTDDAGATVATPAITLTAVAPSPDVGTTTVSLQQGTGYNGTSDTYISNYHKASNFGPSQRMDLDRNNYVPLLRFAIFSSEGGPVPDDAIIESAKLRLYKGAYDSTIALHAMLVPWVETEATWSRPRIGANWSSDGAAGAGHDYIAAADAIVAAPWNPGWLDFDVTDRLRQYATGAPNNGWRLIAGSGNNNRKEIHSSEQAATDTRPILEITWRSADPEGGNGSPTDPDEETPQPPTGGEPVTTVMQRNIAGYKGVADTYLSNYHKTLNFGASAQMELDRNNYVPLLRFAILASEGGPVPDGAVIQTATLHLSKGSYDSVISLHAMRVNWSESEATWNRANSNTSWSAPGASGQGSDYESIADAQVNAPWSPGELVFNVTERVRSIAAGESNMGWRLLAGTGNNNRKQIISSENNSDSVLIPKLVVTWSLPSDE
ncbi:DNRLRE domain-containing protein [Thauera butanivorans]|uniref:DNRLRE domain-containing protein n=1 Tax=Thauera butanivorans TaxID=86174 RepID=UPI003AB33435